MPGRPILKDVVTTKLVKLLKLDNLVYVTYAEVTYLSKNTPSHREQGKIDPKDPKKYQQA